MKKIVTLIVGVGALGAATARAQTSPVPVTPVVPEAPYAATPGLGQPAPPDYPRPAGMPPVVVPGQIAPVSGAPADTLAAGPPVYEPWMSRLGSAVLVGGGYEDFTHAAPRNMTGAGGFWTARLVGGTRQLIGLEAAYIGAARSVDAFGLPSSSNLISNGFEGALRLNLPIIQGRSLVEPFGFVGLGWQHYTVTNAGGNTSNLVGTSDDVMTMPYGAGLEVAYARFIADARVTYRQTYFNDMLRTTGGNLNTWDVGAQVGVEF